MTYQEVYKKLPDRKHCIKILESFKWNDSPICPYCYSDQSASISIENRHHCSTCNCSFSVTVGTVFHNSRLELQKWFTVIKILIDENFKISSRELSRRASINKDTACRIKQLIREAMYNSEERKVILKIYRYINNEE